MKRIQENMYDLAHVKKQHLKAQEHVATLERRIVGASSDEMEDILRQHRAAVIKVQALEERLLPPKDKYEMAVCSTNLYGNES